MRRPEYRVRQYVPTPIFYIKAEHRDRKAIMLVMLNFLSNGGGILILILVVLVIFWLIRKISGGFDEENFQGCLKYALWIGIFITIVCTFLDACVDILN